MQYSHEDIPYYTIFVILWHLFIKTPLSCFSCQIQFTLYPTQFSQRPLPLATKRPMAFPCPVPLVTWHLGIQTNLEISHDNSIYLGHIKRFICYKGRILSDTLVISNTSPTSAARVHSLPHCWEHNSLAIPSFDTMNNESSTVIISIWFKICISNITFLYQK